MVSRIFNVPSLHSIFLMYLWLTSDFPKCRTAVIIIVVNLRLNCLPGVLSWDLGLSNIFGCCLVNSCGGLRKGEPVQNWVHLGKSTMQVVRRAVKLAVLSSKSTCNLCVAFGVQGTHLAVYSCVQFALTADWEALGQF